MTSTDVDVANEVERIAALDLAGLRQAWQHRYGPPPPLRSIELFRQLLAWGIQAEAFGGLDRATRRALGRARSGQAEGLNLGHGACLTRYWKGRRVEVVVEADGFSWEGQFFKSLSAAATAIAGSRWNGPHFFGLGVEQS